MIPDASKSKTELIAELQELRARFTRVEKQSQAELAHERRFLRAVLDNLPVSVYVKDLQGRKILSNRVDLEVVGRSEEEVLGKTDLELFPAEVAEQFWKDDQFVLDRAKALRDQEELALNQSQGRKFWQLTSKVPLHDDNGKMIGLVGIGLDITDRKRTEEELFASQERYSALIERMRDGVYRSTHAGKFVDINSAMLEMFGYDSKEEMMALDIKEELYFDPNDRGNHILNIDQHEFDVYRMRRKDGSEIWVEDRAYYVYDAHGEIAFHEGILRDVTERVRQEQSLRASEEKFRKAFLISPDSININRLSDGMYISINQGFTQVTGYTESDAIGKTSLELQIWENPEDRHRLIEGLRKNGVVHNLEARFRTKNGEVKDGLMSASVIELEGELHILSVTRDISDRKRMEDAIRHSRNMLHLVLDAIPQRVFWKDPNGSFLGCNISFAHIVGLSHPNQVIGKTDFDLVDSLEKAEAYRANDREVLETHQPKLHVIEYSRQADGTPQWSDSTKIPLIDETGRAFAVLGVVEDITERKQAEDERNITIDLLSELAKPNGLQQLMQDVSFLLKHWSGCESVGIRLQDGDDFPYYTTSGFPEKFIRAERYLCARQPDGKIILDGQGNPVLDCMCGNVIRGRFNPELPFFTANGSFWTNSTTDLLASTSEQERQARTRNRCHGEGYESVALIPLRHSEQTLGLLQFNDFRRDRFDDEKIALLERLATNLSLALLQRKTAESLREKEALLSASLSAIDQPFVVINAHDYTIALANEASGGSKLVGEKCFGLLYQRDVPCARDDQRCLMKRIKEIGKPLIDLHAYNDQTGQKRYIEIHAYPIFDENQNLKQIVEYSLDITERKQAEESRLELLERFELIAAHIQGVIYQYRLRPDGTSHFPYASAGIQNIYGVLPHEVEQDATAAFQALHPDDLAQVRASIELSARTMTPWHDIYRVNLPSGKTIWVEGHSTPQKLADGSIVWHGYIQDVTERQKVHVKINQLSQAIVQSPVSVVIADLDGNIEYVNPKFCSVTGYSFDEVIGRNPRILKSGEMSSEDYQELWNLITSGKEWRGEFHNKKKNGELFWEHSTISAIKNQQGEITNFVAVKEDITERKRTESALIESESLLQIAGKTAQFGGWSVDLATRKATWSKQVALIHDKEAGYSPFVEEAIQFYAPEWRDKMTRIFNTCALEGIPYDEEMEIITARGRRIWVRTIGGVTMDSTGKIVGLQGSIQDITERKNSEHNLEIAYDSTLRGWSAALELREHETAGHSQRVVEITLELARKMGLAEEKIIHIQRGALLHDIGKMGIPDSILLKPAPLTDDEWIAMRQHPQFAYRMLSKIDYLRPALEIPYCHHEKWDGSGYPRGLKGNEIPLAARIFSIVDTWDALSHDRPYRPAWPGEAVIAYLKKQSGKQFDPLVVENFVELLNNL